MKKTIAPRHSLARSHRFFYYLPFERMTARKIHNSRFPYRDFHAWWYRFFTCVNNDVVNNKNMDRWTKNQRGRPPISIKAVPRDTGAKEGVPVNGNEIKIDTYIYGTKEGEKLKTDTKTDLGTKPKSQKERNSGGGIE